MVLTQFQLGLLVLLAIFIFLLFLFGILWIRRKYPKAERFNTFIIAFVLILALYLIALLAMLIGIYTKEDIKKATPYFGVALIIFWVMIFIAQYWFKKPIPTEKLWREYVLPTIEWKWNGRIYRGTAYMPAIRFNNVISTRQHPDLKQYGHITDLVEVFFGVFMSHTKFMALQIHNKFTGEDLKGVLNPSWDIVFFYLGREAKSSYDTAMDELEEVKTPQAERRAIVRE